MTEAPDTVYGRLLESAHISGYTFERVCSELEWLLEDDRWQQVGPGHADVNAFLRTVDLSAFNLGENRPKLIKRIKELQPGASTRAIGKATGTPQSSVRRSLREDEPNGSPAEDEPCSDLPKPKPTEPNGSPESWFQDDDVAGYAKNAAKRREKEAAREQMREENRALVDGCDPLELDPETRYRTVVIDPPWDWGDEGDADQLGRARPTYETRSYAQLAMLPVGKQADDDAHLYLWITNRSLPKGFGLLELWGFRYVTTLTWCKPHFGMGNYYRGQTEHALFGVRGSLPLLRNDRGTRLEAPRPGKHSSKPDEFYRLVEECSPGPWLEIFNRNGRRGWSVWGAEA